MGPKDWKKFETNKKNRSQRSVFSKQSEEVEKIRRAYISKHNSKHENQVIISMITDSEK